jgi:hypothetical protein
MTDTEHPPRPERDALYFCGHHLGHGIQSNRMENLTRHRLAIGAMGRRTSRCNGPGLAVLAPLPLSGDVGQTRNVRRGYDDSRGKDCGSDGH